MGSDGRRSRSMQSKEPRNSNGSRKKSNKRINNAKLTPITVRLKTSSKFAH